VSFRDVRERVSEFASMSDEELEAYVNGDRSLEH
jgi:hypothetical protein